MLKNYFKTAVRNLRRNRSYALINIAGLAVGIAASFLVFLVIRFESSFDDFHAKKDRIYRVGTEFHNQDGVDYSGGSSFPVATALRLDFPQLTGIASTYRNDGQITIEGAAGEVKKLTEENFFYIEPSFFKLFDFGWLAGSPEVSLNDPNNVVLTQATAEKYFGNWKAALGKTLKLDNKTLYTVTGILKNVPPTTDFPLSAVTSYASLQNTYLKNNANDWVSTFGQAYTFVVLPPALSPESFNEQLKAFAKKHRPAEYASNLFYAQPLKELHYDERFGNYSRRTFSHSLINALSVIGLFLMVIACMNFINLATAQAVNRSKEVGVRKVLGGNRRQLALQFLGETAFIVFISLVMAVVIAFIALPFLNKLLQTEMSLNVITRPSLLLFLLAAGIFVTLLSGLYPAVILSGFNPVTALKKEITAKRVGGISLRRALVVLQFAIAQVLLIGMFIVVSQMNFFTNASLGFDKEAVVNVPVPGDSISKVKMTYMRNQLLARPEIQSASFGFATPSSQINDWNSDFKFNHSTKKTDFEASLKWADVDYFKTYNLQFVAGRPYAAGDTVREFVVNENLLHRLGLSKPQDILGKELNFWNGNKVGPVVGVIKDFNSYSLRTPMSPVVMSTWKDVYQTISIKLKPGTAKTALPFIEKLWNGQFPDYVYAYSFLDETINNFYRQERQLSLLYKIFAAIAVFISCLGLYGLVSFMAVRRTKEVGIRKVLGASARNIVFLLSKEFTLLVLLAFLLSAPTAYYIMNKWLQNYPYRISLGTSIFLLAVVSSVMIAWLTVAHRAIKAAVANPVKSLRTE